MRNITKIIIITTVFVIINLLYQFPDTVHTVNLVSCDEIRPVKLVIESKGYYPRHLSQCGWKLKDLVIHIILLLLPFSYLILDPQLKVTRILRKIIIFLTSLLLVSFASYTLFQLLQYPTSIVENIYTFSRSGFIFNCLLEKFLATCWLVRVFTKWNSMFTCFF